MALNLEALRKKVADLDSKNKKAAKTTWKPDGEHEVRCLPLEGSEDLAHEKYFHYNIGTHFKLYCPKNDGEDCAVCDFADKLKSWNDENGKEKPKTRREADFKAFRELQAGPKYYIPIGVRKSKTAEDLDEPIWWEISPSVYKQLLNICMNEDYNEDHPDGGALAILTSLKHGRDLTVKFIKPGAEGNQTSFNKTTAEERKKSKPLLADQAAAKKYVERIPDFDTAVKPLSAQEVEKIFTEFLASGTPDAEPGEPGIEKTATVSSNNAEKLTGTKSPDQAMDKLREMISKGSKETSKEG